MPLPPTTEIQHLLALDRAERLRSSMQRPRVSLRRRLGSFMVSAGIRLDPLSLPDAVSSPASAGLGSTDDAPAEAGASCALARAA
jgi:hypothetical protein